MNNTLPMKLWTYGAIGLFAVVATMGAVMVRSQGIAHAEVSSTTPPTISAVAATTTDTTASITWTTNQAATSQINYGTSTFYGASTTLNSALETSHLTVLLGLQPNTLYHFQIVSTNASSSMATSSDYTFMTTNTVGDLSSSTIWAAINDLQNQINQLKAKIGTLEDQIEDLMDEDDNGGGGTGTTTSHAASISANNWSVRAGTTVDFTGRNWGVEEDVVVTSEGLTVRTAHADLGGNFSTGSITVPTTLGTKTYTFVGQDSGITKTATITIIP